jgi:hypothetical protein
LQQKLIRLPFESSGDSSNQRIQRVDGGRLPIVGWIRHRHVGQLNPIESPSNEDGAIRATQTRNLRNRSFRFLARRMLPVCGELPILPEDRVVVADLRIGLEGLKFAS